MKKFIFSLLLGLGVIHTAVAVEGSVEAGKSKSALCAACHGATGTSAIPNYPDLAGQHGPYIIKQLDNFQNGNRNDPMMAPMAANLSEQDKADLAAYFSSLPWGGVVEEATTADSGTGASTGSAVVKVEINKSIVFHNGGDPEAGYSKSGMCAACHGADGNSLVANYPKLAGQGADYIAKQLADFKSSARKDPVMAGMVAALSTQDMADLGAFFSSQKISAGHEKTNEVGRKLYFGGDAERGITACVACHAASGKGVSQAKFPSVAGQHVAYLTSQLDKFRSGARDNDNSSIMRKIAMKLTDDDITALTEYMSSLK